MRKTMAAGSKAAGAVRAGGDTRWFVNDRFGMFIHWGLYAMPARHEWIRHHERISSSPSSRPTP